MEIFNGILRSIGNVFSAVWWLVVPLALFFIFLEFWVSYLESRFLKNIKWVMLEIKVPREVLKTPKAMEQIFAACHATYSFGFRFMEKYWEGAVEYWMSFEMVGYSGGVYFFIRLPSQYRNMIEAAIYAQYPDAEIAEREDYTELFPSLLPNQVYDFWGADLILTKDDPYPIRTYPYFEAVEEEQRIDTVSGITETMSKLKEGEAIWLQILVRPTGNDWKEKGEELVAKLVGKKKPKETGFVEWFGVFMRNLLIAWREPPDWTFGGSAVKSDETKMIFLTPGERDVVKAIEDKLSKIGFECNMRFIYIDRKDSFTRSNVAAVIGALRQFNTLNLNGFKINKQTYTKAYQPFKERKLLRRKRLLFELYKARAFPGQFGILRWQPGKSFILNTEELATIFHFPTITVEAPMLRHLESKKGGPPPTLPIE